MEFPKGVQADNVVRDRYEVYAHEHGAVALHALLASRDPESAAAIHPNNVRRVVRALEMLDQGVSCRTAGGLRTRALYQARYLG
jgi:tRNA dimethylallyltransferase